MSDREDELHDSIDELNVDLHGIEKKFSALEEEQRERLEELEELEEELREIQE